MRDMAEERLFEVPEKDQRPPVPMSEYYSTLDQTMILQHFRTLQQYPRLDIGSVTHSGVHSDLPPAALWRNGVIDIGPHVEVELEKAKEKAALGQRVTF